MASAKWFRYRDDRAVNALTDGPEHYERRSEFYDTVRTVCLGSMREPTAARWASFGWRVKVEKVSL